MGVKSNEAADTSILLWPLFYSRSVRKCVFTNVGERGVEGIRVDNLVVCNVEDSLHRARWDRPSV